MKWVGRKLKLNLTLRVDSILFAPALRVGECSCFVISLKVFVHLNARNYGSPFPLFLFGLAFKMTPRPQNLDWMTIFDPNFSELTPLSLNFEKSMFPFVLIFYKIKTVLHKGYSTRRVVTSTTLLDLTLSSATPASPPPPLNPSDGNSPSPPRSLGALSLSTTRSPLPPPGSSSSRGGGIGTRLVVSLALEGLDILVAISLLFRCCCEKKKRDDKALYYMPPPPPGP